MLGSSINDGASELHNLMFAKFTAVPMSESFLLNNNDV
jgi:hypothetical protein